MSRYFTNFIRAFKPGAPRSIVQDVIEEFNSVELDSQGVVAGTFYSPIHPSGVVFLSRALDDASGIDKYHEAVRNSSETRQKLVAKLSEQCASTKMRISRVIKEGNYVGSKPPTCIVRNYIKAKRGHLDEVIDTISSFIDEIPEDRTKPLLTESTTGRSNMLLLSIPFESFGAAEDSYALQRSTWGTARGRRLSDITEENVRIPTQIFHSNIQMS